MDLKEEKAKAKVEKIQVQIPCFQLDVEPTAPEDLEDEETRSSTGSASEDEAVLDEVDVEAEKRKKADDDEKER